MILNEERKQQLIEMLETIPESNWETIERIIKEQQPKELEIETYLQKMYEDDKFCLIANFEDGTDNNLSFIEFTDKRGKTPIELVWDNDAWWLAVCDDEPESVALLDAELLPIVKQFLKQILKTPKPY